jgi:hypothetical protein
MGIGFHHKIGPRLRFSPDQSCRPGRAWCNPTFIALRIRSNVADRVGPVGGRAKNSTKKSTNSVPGVPENRPGRRLFGCRDFCFFEGRAVSCHATCCNHPALHCAAHPAPWAVACHTRRLRWRASRSCSLDHFPLRLDKWLRDCRCLSRARARGTQANRHRLARTRMRAREKSLKNFAPIPLRRPTPRHHSHSKGENRVSPSEAASDRVVDTRGARPQKILRRTRRPILARTIRQAIGDAVTHEESGAEKYP